MNSISLNNNGVSSQFLNELKNPTIDLLTDYSNIYIDDFLQNEGLKEIPIIKTVIGVLNFGVAVNQIFMAKKLVTFIREFNDGSVSENNYNLFRHKLETDYNYSQRLAEKLMVIIDRQVEITQTKITANLLKAHVNNNLTYDELNNILLTLNNLHPSSYQFFFELENNDSDPKKGKQEREIYMEQLITSGGFGLKLSPWSSTFKLSEEGIQLFEYGLKPLHKNS